MSQLESDRTELQGSVETLEDRVGELRAHELLSHSNLPAVDRVTAAWDSFLDGVAGWVSQFDGAVQRLSHFESTATQADADAADALARLA